MSESGEVWWRQARFKKILKVSLWLLLPLSVLTCHQMVKHQRSRSYLASDSTTIANGRTSKNILFDSSTHTLADRELSDFIRLKDDRISISKKLTTFYRENDYHTKWLGKKSPTKEYYGLVKLFQQAPAHGLSVEAYSLADIERDLREVYEEGGDGAELPELDMRITERFFLFAKHLRDGQIKPAGHDKALWKSAVKETSNEDVSALLDASGNDLSGVIKKLQPQTEQYQKLLEAYARLVELDKQYKGKFDKIAIDRKIRPGEKHEKIPAIRRRISLLESRQYEIPYDTATGTPDSLLYDADLANGMKSFQQHHGLEPTTIIGGKTVTFLNTSFRERAAKVALSLERERWKPQQYGDRYIIVNVPDFMLRAYQKGKEKLAMKVVVGAPEKPTPIFNDVLEYIIFSPTWTVPTSIIEEEILPRIKEDPDYYSERNYTFYRNKSEIDPLDEDWDEDIDPRELTIVQQPGEDNALGLVKFVMPNHLNIYLHDTPQQRLFKKYWRAFSHGCIRLDEPEKFAEYLLDEKSKWNREKIDEAMHAEEPETVKLKDFHSVYIDYQTAWVDEDGNLNFRDDVYGHDRVHLKQLGPLVSESV